MHGVSSCALASLQYTIDVEITFRNWRSSNQNGLIRKAQQLGIRTVAVHSEADQDGLHVELADEAILIGASPVSESYLDIDRVLQACQSTGADAVHPGYGFLSENFRFVQALEQAGIRFVGPSARAIKTMGDKIASKQLAASAGVSVIPGLSLIHI